LFTAPLKSRPNATTGLIVAGIFVVVSIGKSETRLIDIGTFVVITLTLISLIIYANDTNRLTKFTKMRYDRDIIINATYEMVDRDHNGRTYFSLINNSNLFVRAKVCTEICVYAEPIKVRPEFSGTIIRFGWYFQAKQVLIALL